MSRFLDQAELELHQVYERQGRELWAATRRLLARSYQNGIEVGYQAGLAAREPHQPTPEIPHSNGQVSGSVVGLPGPSTWTPLLLLLRCHGGPRYFENSLTITIER